MKHENSFVLCVRIPNGVKNLLDQEAARQNTTVSELARQYIDTGLSVEGFKTNIDMITDILEQSTKNALEPQINRLVKLLMKVGKINGAGYFLQLANMINANDRTSILTTTETVRDCNRLALDYMNQKDSDVERFLSNNEELVEKALRLKITEYLDFDDIPDL